MPIGATSDASHMIPFRQVEFHFTELPGSALSMEYTEWNLFDDVALLT
jgi:hypothetical protein